MLWVLIKASQRGTSKESQQQHIFLWRNGENYPRIIVKYSSITTPQSTDAEWHKWYTYAPVWLFSELLFGYFQTRFYKKPKNLREQATKK